MSLIHPQSEAARVQDDFERQIAGVQHAVEIERIAVAMNNAEGIAAAIERATGSIVVLIKGGGDSSAFNVFDQKIIVEAWARKSAYKAVGLGREGTRATLIDFLSDYAGSTPTGVGAFRSQQIATNQQRRSDVERLQHQCQALQETRISLSLQLENAQQRTQTDRNRPLIWAAFVMGIVLVLGVFIG